MLSASMIGRTLSHYKITAKLGEGGMGEVYRAHDTELDREVALKVLPADRAEDPDRLVRFEREAKAVAALNHPNIVTIHSIEEADGIRFLTMELVEGQSLDQMLPAEGLPLAQVFDIAVPMADALAAAHEKGIVHRDLKPANVMVTQQGRVKVLDFGLAKLAADAPVPGADAATEAATLTGEGKVIGTAPYMSPEQLQGKTVDYRTDIFSLGVVLFEMVSGERPFKGESGIDLASRILRETPASVTDLRADLPRHLGRIIQHCLEKDPERRYQSAKDVRNELEGLRDEIESDVVMAGSHTRPRASTAQSAINNPPSGSAATQFSNKPAGPTPFRQRVWITVVVALLILLALGVWWWVGRSRPQPADSVAVGTPAEATEEAPVHHASPPSIAVLPFADVSPEGNQEYFTDGLTDELINTLTRIPDLRVTGRTSAFQFKGKNEDPKVIGEKLNVSAILEGSVRKAGDQVRINTQLVSVADGFQLWSETYDRTLDDIFQVQDDIASSVAEALEVTLLGDSAKSAVHPPDPEAYNLLLQSRYHRNLGTLEGGNRAAELLEQALTIDPDYAEAWADLGVVHANRGYFAGSSAAAQQEYQQAFVNLNRALEIDPDLAIAHSRLAWLHEMADWDFAAADRSRQKALILAPNDAGVLTNSAALLIALGRPEEAIELYHRGLKTDPLNTITQWNLAIAFYANGQFAEAESSMKQILDLTPDSTGSHLMLGQIYLQQGRAAEALAEFEREPLRWKSLQGRALAYEALGEREKSDSAIQQLEAEFGDDAAWELAQVHAYRGETDLAFEWLETAYKVHDTGLRDVKVDPLLRGLHQDPRWPPFLDKMGLPH